MTMEELETLEEIKKYHKEEKECEIKRNSEWEAFLKEFNSAEERHLNDPKRKRWYDLGNGHALMVQAANRGLEDDFLVEFYEDCKLLDREYATAEVMAKEQEKQGKRLETLEGQDGDKWKTVVKCCLTGIVTFVIGYVLPRLFGG